MLLSCKKTPPSINHKKHTSLFYRYLNEIIIITLLILIGSLVLWTAHTRFQDFSDNQVRLVEGSAQSASHEITLLVKEIRRQVNLFAQEHEVMLDDMAFSPHDKKSYSELKQSVEKYFPNAFAFTISDIHGQVLLDDFKAPVGSGCRTDILDYSNQKHLKAVYIHGNPDDPMGNHFDMMSTWGDSDDSESLGGIFFVSFLLDDIQRLLQNAQIIHNELITVKQDKPTLIEVTATGARKSLSRETNLSPEEEARVNVSRHIEGTQWLLKNLPNKHLFTDRQQDISLDALYILLSFIFISAIMLYFIIRAKKQLAQSQTQLIQSEKMASLGQMVAGLAHEMNTPLGYVKSNLGIIAEHLPLSHELAHENQTLSHLMQHSPQDKQAISQQLKICLSKGSKFNNNLAFQMLDQLIKDSEHGLNQIAELILSLKDFSRIDRGEVTRYDIHDCLNNVLRIASHLIKYKATVVTEFKANQQITGSPARMNQVFLNIITNAVQSMETMGTITIQTSSTKSRLTIRISDTGKGIAKEHIHQVFDPFFTTKPVGEGTGLGLSIVHQIIQDEGGTIHVESTQGKGTTFTITFAIT